MKETFHQLVQYPDGSNGQLCDRWNQKLRIPSNLPDGCRDPKIRAFLRCLSQTYSQGAWSEVELQGLEPRIMWFDQEFDSLHHNAVPKLSYVYYFI